MIKNVKTLTTSQLLQLRESYRADIRSLDDINFKIISAISTVTLGILTAGTALRNPDFIVFFFVGIAIVNCLAVEMLLKNRISVLEKTWYVCYFESRLPSEYRQFSSFGFGHFEQSWPKGTAYGYMIDVHRILIIVGFVWALAASLLFREYSQLILANFFSSISGIPMTNLPIVAFYLDNLFWLGSIIGFGILTAYVWNFKIKQSYEERWKNSIWAKRLDLLESLKKRYTESNGKKQTVKNKLKRSWAELAPALLAMCIGGVLIGYSMLSYFPVIYPSYASSPVPKYAEDPYAFLFFTSEDITQSAESSLFFWIDEIQPQEGICCVHVIADFYRLRAEANDENSSYFVLQVFQNISDIGVTVNGQSPVDYGGRERTLSYPKKATSYLLIDIPNENFTTGGHITMHISFTWKEVFWRQSFYRYNLLASFNTNFPSFVNEVGLPTEAINGNGMLIPDVTTRTSLSIAKPESNMISATMPDPDIVGFNEGKIWYNWDIKKRSDRDRYASTSVSIDIEVAGLKRRFEETWAYFTLCLGIGVPLVISSLIKFWELFFYSRKIDH